MDFSKELVEAVLGLATGTGELALIDLMPNRPPEGSKFNLGDDDEGGEMSEGFMDTALKSNFYQQNVVFYTLIKITRQIL